MLKSVTRLIDLKYCGYSQQGAVYLLISKLGEAALIDSGTPHSFPIILDVLKENNVRREDLTTLIVTHSHLDHSGGTSLFAQTFPNIKIYAHPKAMKNLIDPVDICNRMSTVIARHWVSEFGNKVYPIDKKLLHETNDGMQIVLGGSRVLSIIDTPGHSQDHICVKDHETNTIFTADAFASRYELIDKYMSVYAIAPGYVHQQSVDSVRKIMSFKPDRVGIAHFGYIHDVQRQGELSIKFAESVRREFLKDPDHFTKDVLIKDFDKLFGHDCTKKWHRLNGLMNVTYRGLLASRNQSPPK